MSDAYYQPPEPTSRDLMEWANQDADNLVAEWATLGEYEVTIDVQQQTRSGEPLFDVRRVACDGEVLYRPKPDYGPGEQFDTIEELRTWLSHLYPLPS